MSHAKKKKSRPSPALRIEATRDRGGVQRWGVPIALAILTLLAFSPVWQYGFVDLDDPGYVADNPHVASGLSAANIAWAFTTGHAANWHPLTWLSHMLDAQIFGVAAGPHHAINLLLHVANTLLLFFVLVRMTGARTPSAFVAGLFGVHPLHVESVAWIAERKDVLSTLFWMLTMWAYVSYVRKPAASRYIWIVVWFGLGLLAKPMLVTLPFVLMLLDVWPLGRARGLWRDKVPLFAMAALSSIVTFVVQRQGGAVNSLDVMPIGLRIANALVAYVTYLWHMIWPDGLAVFYPFRTQLPWGAAIGAATLLVGVTIAVLRQRERRPYLPVGWFWYVGTLVPVIGLVQVGTQALADRYTYVPLVGVWIGLAWLAWEAWERRPAALAAAQAAVLIGLAVVTHAQVQTWQNSHTLWQHAVDVTSDNYRARNSLGAVLGNEGRPADAIVHFTEALRLRPDQSEAFHIHHNLGRALSDLGRVDEAIGHYQEALRLKPDFPEARNNLGLAYARQRQFEPAIEQYERALKERPGFAPALTNLASAHNELGFLRFGQARTEEAIAEYSRALAINPRFVLALYNRGFAFGADGRMAEAIADLTAAVGLDPKFEPAQLGLGIALASVGRVDEAVRHLTIVLELNPANEGARRALDRLTKRGKQP